MYTLPGGALDARPGSCARGRPAPGSWCWVVWIALVAAPLTAYGGGPDQTRRAAEAIRAGIEAYQATRYEEALGFFETARSIPDAVDDRAGLWFNIGRCLEELKRWPRAIEAFEASVEADTDTEARARTAERIRALEQQLGAVRVDCSGSPIRVRIGPGPSQPCGHTFTRLMPGPAVLVAEGEGDFVVETHIEVERGLAVAMRLTMPGRLRVLGAGPDTVMWIGDAMTPVDGPTALDLAPGPLSLRISGPSQPEMRLTATVAAGRVTTIMLTPQTPAEVGGGLEGPVLVAAGLAVTAMGGVLFGLAEWEDDSAAAAAVDAEMPELDAFHRFATHADRAASYRVAGGITTLVGLAIAGTGAVWWWGESGTSGVDIAPSLDADGPAARLRLRF